jgi:RHH-type proline utilization regulon transcriptional repressor/proline dehydrogenase/delta 1-pyrroline-5-carboxylate dehydrogenase
MSCFPQFATHNALTVATIVEMAHDRNGFEFQRLHGMGEVVYESLGKGNDRVPCRIYAPVGGYRDLLAYLVRRLLENGANSSFVAVAGDRNVPIADLLERPDAKLGLPRGNRPATARFRCRSGDLSGPARIRAASSSGTGFSWNRCSPAWSARVRVDAGPLAPGLKGDSSGRRSVAIADPSNVVGTVRFTDPKDVDKAVDAALQPGSKTGRGPTRIPRRRT